MPTITYVAFDGTETAVDAEVGTNLMALALDRSVQGIDGDCGGNCACATCHVYVDDPRAAGLSEPDEMEDAMLDMTAARAPSSRLGCQVVVTPEMDGLVVRLPESQN